MLVADLVQEALLLMLIGMGSVFAFLFILVLLVQALSHWLPVVANPQPGTTGVNTQAETAVPAPVVAAISVAIHHYRQHHQ